MWAFYYTARTDVKHVDWSSALCWRSLLYIRGSIVAVGLYVSWDMITLHRKKNLLKIKLILTTSKISHYLMTTVSRIFLFHVITKNYFFHFSFRNEKCFFVFFIKNKHLANKSLSNSNCVLLASWFDIKKIIFKHILVKIRKKVRLVYWVAVNYTTNRQAT